MTPAKKVVKCPLCFGGNVSIQQQGLELLETVPTRLSELKKAFLGMRSGDQQKLVDILTQSGIQITVEKQKPITPVSLLAEVMRLAYDKKKREKSPEVQEFLMSGNILLGVSASQLWSF